MKREAIFDGFTIGVAILAGLEIDPNTAVQVMTIVDTPGVRSRIVHGVRYWMHREDAGIESGVRTADRLRDKLNRTQ